MAKRKEQTMNYKTIHRKLKIVQDPLNPGMNSGLH